MGSTPVSDKVYVAGNFTSWASGKIELTREGITSFYSVTCYIPKTYNLEYKYINNGDYETRGNRTYDNLECDFTTNESWNA